MVESVVVGRCTGHRLQLPRPTVPGDVALLVHGVAGASPELVHRAEAGLAEGPREQRHRVGRRVVQSMAFKKSV